MRRLSPTVLNSELNALPSASANRFPYLSGCFAFAMLLQREQRLFETYIAIACVLTLEAVEQTAMSHVVATAITRFLR